MRERTVEKYLTSRVKSIGGWALKIICLGVSGIPDRLVIYRGRAYFVELKRPGGTVSPIQKLVHKLLKKYGFEVHILYCREDVESFIELIEDLL